MAQTYVALLRVYAVIDLGYVLGDLLIFTTRRIGARSGAIFVVSTIMVYVKGANMSREGVFGITAHGAFGGVSYARAINDDIKPCSYPPSPTFPFASHYSYKPIQNLTPHRISTDSQSTHQHEIHHHYRFFHVGTGRRPSRASTGDMRDCCELIQNDSSCRISAGQ
jgi:hypothetical protein